MTKINIPATLVLSMVLMLLPFSLWAQGSYSIYFGDIHSHTWYSDGSQDKDTTLYKKPVAQAITYARSSPSMNFLGVSDHNHNEGGLHMTLGYWRAGNQEADSVNQDGVFPGLYGQEWGTISAGGHSLIYGTNKLFGWDTGVFDVYVAKGNYGMLFDSLKKYSGFVYLAHPNQGDFGGIFTGAYNASWDSVVMGVAMRNGPATSTNTTETNPSTTDYSARYHDLLRLGYHVAPCANQDNHNTTFGRVNQQRTAVLASSLTRAGVFDALRNRRAYATEDHNLQLRIEVGSHSMGEIFTMTGPVTLRVSAIDPDGEHMTRIELRYGVPGSGSAPTVLTSVTGLDSLTYTQTQPANSTYYYYAYVVENDGQSAWSAPLWITTSTVAPPPIVTLLSPSNGATNQTVTPLLQWRTSTTATSYRVQVATDSTFGSGIVLDDTSVVDTTKAASGLNYVTRYFWRVNAKNSGGSSGFSSSSSFTTQSAMTQTITASSGSNGIISPTGPVSVATGANQSFTISPNAGYHVDSVVVDGAKVDSTTSYTFVSVATNHTIRAVFTINQFTIAATAGSNGAISPSGSVTVNYGVNRTFIVTPNTGYHVDSVLVDGVRVDSATSYTFVNVTAAHTIRAVFAINHYTLTASSGVNGSIVPVGTVTVTHGGNQTFVITPLANYQVDSVLVDGVRVDSTTSYTFVTVIAAHTIRVVFAINQYAITASAGGNGSISPTGSVLVNHGANRTFSVTPSAGYHVDSLLVDGVKVDSTTSYTFVNVIAVHTIRVVFAINQYAITASAGANGSISPTGFVLVNHGVNRTFTVTPGAGYHVDSVLVDGVKVDSTTSYTFVNVSTAHAIRVVFAVNHYSIVSSSGSNGSIIPSGSVDVLHGGDQTFLITPATHHHIDSVIVDGARVDSLSSYTFRGVTGNHTIRSVFATDQYGITAEADSHGVITPSGVVSVSYGGNKTFTISPETGYHADSLFVDTMFVDSTMSYTFVGVTGNHTIRVTFSINHYTIGATAGPHGGISPSGSVSVIHGATMTYTATPDEGYSAHFAVDGVPLRPDVLRKREVHVRPAAITKGSQWDGVPITHTFTSVASNHLIDASFTIDTMTILATAGSHGSISPGGVVPMIYGSTRTFTMTPAQYYHVDSVLVDGVHVDSTTSYTFVNVTSGHTIEAFFGTTLVSIVATAGLNGSITPSGVIPVPVGSSQTFTINADFGYELDSVFVDGISSISVSHYQFTNISASHTIHATFRSTLITEEVHVTQGWNAISLPLIVSDGRKDTLFPSASSSAYAFSSSTGYVARDTLKNAIGYWLKFPSTQTVTILGLTSLRDTLQVLPGWNLIGAISVTAIADSVVQIPPGIVVSPFYGYTGSYVVSDTLMPARAYWVKVNQAGELIIK